MDTLESLHRKMYSAQELKSVVRTMKAMAASNIGQYEMSVNALGDYYRTVALGIVAYFMEQNVDSISEKAESKVDEQRKVCAIVFGSDQGLVGQFNDRLCDFVSGSLQALPGRKEVWSVGERIQLLMSDAGYTSSRFFSLPNSVNAITPLVREILIKSMDGNENGNVNEFYVFHNQPQSKTGYTPVIQRILPLDKKWRHRLTELHWPTKKLPQVAGAPKPTLSALVREYLFVSLFKACAESLASENASRLEAMQRAEKNIEDLLEDLGHKFHRLRQSSIDEELFDVVSGFEALKNNPSSVL